MWARCRLEGLDELPDDCDVEGPGLLGRGDDLVSGQNEPKATCVTNIKKMYQQNVSLVKKRVLHYNNCKLYQKNIFYYWNECKKCYDYFEFQLKMS